VYDSDMMDARKYEVCEICKTNQATEWNHCLVNKDNRFQILNRIYNLQHVCHPCHDAIGHTTDNRSAFWWKQYLKYGDEFLEWWDEVTDTLVRNLGYAAMREAAEFERKEESRCDVRHFCK